VTDTDPPRVDPASEEIIITWLAGGHNGGCLAFGPDGYLYISTGDATPPSPPDGLDAGQDMSRLLSGILRIDVDRRDGDRPYSIPPDNPFVTLEGARPEKWAYGFRNPWKISFDRTTGDLWCGDVGWELWELVHRIERGGNYGWSIMEGPQPVKVEGRRGPTPILPPTIALPHSEAASVTGGYVYRGKKFPALAGAYVSAIGRRGTFGPRGGTARRSCGASSSSSRRCAWSRSRNATTASCSLPTTTTARFTNSSRTMRRQPRIRFRASSAKPACSHPCPSIGPRRA
jgi:hypothetical protein